MKNTIPPHILLSKLSLPTQVIHSRSPILPSILLATITIPYLIPNLTLKLMLIPQHEILSPITIIMTISVTITIAIPFVTPSPLTLMFRQRQAWIQK